MSAEPVPYVTVEDYLAAESSSVTKHEYLDGVVHAMAGASLEHNLLASQLIRLLGNALDGSDCDWFGSDMQVKLHSEERTYFYYPDAMIACDAAERRCNWRERPSVLFEIISESTRNIDEREKRIAYLQLPSLQAYVRIEQGRREVVVEWRTSEGWQMERLIGNEAVLRLREPQVEIRLADLYRRVEWVE